MKIEMDTKGVKIITGEKSLDLVWDEWRKLRDIIRIYDYEPE